MPDLFDLTPFQKFELWVGGLQAYHSKSGPRFGQSDPVPVHQNYSEDVKTSILIVQDMIRLTSNIVLEEIEEFRGTEPALVIDSTKDLRPQIRRFHSRAPELEELTSFWDFLEQYKLLGMSMTRLTHLSRLEFRAYGSLLTDRIARLKNSGVYGSLLDRSLADGEFRYLMQRDIVFGLEMPGIQEQMEIILLEFFRILRLIRYIQDEMRQRFDVRKLLVLFGYCYLSYQSFIDLLNRSREYLDRYQPEIVEAIFSATFALKTETRKVFDEHLGSIRPDATVEETYAEMEDALGLTQNAFRQCFVGLIHLLNPRFDERRLFDDMRQRHEQSVTLMNDLTELRQLSKDAGEGDDQTTWVAVLQALETFMETSMLHLFFKDREPIQAFNSELRQSVVDDRRFLLHRFEIFLTTLLGEVSKRWVLTKFRSSRQG